MELKKNFFFKNLRFFALFLRILMSQSVWAFRIFIISHLLSPHKKLKCFCICQQKLEHLLSFIQMYKTDRKNVWFNFRKKNRSKVHILTFSHSKEKCTVPNIIALRDIFLKSKFHMSQCQTQAKKIFFCGEF